MKGLHNISLSHLYPAAGDKVQSDFAHHLVFPTNCHYRQLEVCLHNFLVNTSTIALQTVVVFSDEILLKELNLYHRTCRKVNSVTQFVCKYLLEKIFEEQKIIF